MLTQVRNPYVSSFPGKFILFLISFLLFVEVTSATNYYSATGGGDPSVLTNWWTVSNNTGSHPANFTSGDNFIMQSNMTSNSNWTVSGVGSLITINSGFTYQINTYTVTLVAITINGTLSLYNSGSNSYLFVNGAFTNNGTFNYGQGTVTFGTGGNIAGTNSTTFCNLTINTTNSTDIIPITNAPGLVMVTYNSGGCNLILKKGIFKIGTGNTFILNTTGGPGTIQNPNATGTSNLATTGTNGSDGGRVVLGQLTSGGNTCTISGPGITTFYDLVVGGYTVGSANVTVNQSSAGIVVINDSLTFRDNNASWNNNYPIYASTSTLYINNNGQALNPPNSNPGNKLVWSAMASGTIGTTPGYPNNVTLVNMGTSAGDNCGFKPTGTWSINGTLAIGDGTYTAYASLGGMTSFTCGGITINNNSVLRTSNTCTFTDNGNWLQQGVTTGIFAPTNAGSTVIFAGSGTSSSPQIIQSTGSSTTVLFGGTYNGTTNYANVTVNNGTYINLLSPVTLQSSNILTLNSGIVQTSSTNIMSITNTATTGITSGGKTAYINGPVNWTMANSATNTYTFPVGDYFTDSTYFLPFQITPDNSGTTGNIATVQAFHANSGGTPDGTTVLELSPYEYWSLSTTQTLKGTISNSSVSVSRVDSLSPFDRLAESPTLTGVYSAIGQTIGSVYPGTEGIVNSTTIGSSTSSPWFFVLADNLNQPLPVIFTDVQVRSLYNNNIVQWAAQNQQNVLNYVIERSTDGIQFLQVGAVPANSSTLTYQWTDPNPGSGYLYYRIKAISNNGEVQYSNIVVINSNPDAGNIVADMNAVNSGVLSLRFMNMPQGIYTVSVTNNIGQELQQKTTINFIGGTAGETIGIQLPPVRQVYYVLVSGPAGYQKVIKILN